MDKPILELRGVNKGYVQKRNRRDEKIRAVRDVRFSVNRQHIGSGTSTIAKLITGVERSDSGQIIVDGQPEREWRRDMKHYRRQVQMVFQDPYAALNPLTSVRYAISRPLVNYHGLRDEKLSEEIQRILEIVHLTPVAEFIDKLPFELSGGQLQRVVTARAIASRPQLIVADEPVSMLEVSIRAEILRLIEELRTHQGVTFLYITHDLISARMLADEIIVLYRGTVVEKGNAAAVAKKPLHPYTELLLQSIPNPFSPTMEPSSALGRIDRVSDTGGCVFRARCPHAMPICDEEIPLLKTAGSNHEVACFLHQEVGNPEKVEVGSR